MSVFTVERFAAYALEHGAAIRFKSDTALVVSSEKGVHLTAFFDATTRRFANAFSLYEKDGFRTYAQHETLKSAMDALGLPGADQLAAAA